MNFIETDLCFQSEQEYVSCLLWEIKTKVPTIISDSYSLLLKSDQPTRHVAIASKSLYNVLLSREDLVKDIMSSVKDTEIRAVYLNISSNADMIISYYSLSHAVRCSEFIEKKYKFDYKTFYAKPCSINKNMNEKVFVVISGASQKFDYMHYLTRIGTIRSISLASILPNHILINLEYDDERSNEKLLCHYNNALIEDVQLNVYIASNDHHLCDCCNSTQKKQNKLDICVNVETRSSLSYDDDYGYFLSDIFAFKNNIISDTPVPYTSPTLMFSPSLQQKRSSSASLSSSTQTESQGSSRNSSSTNYSSWKDAITNGTAKKTPTKEPQKVEHRNPVMIPSIQSNFVDVESINKGLDTRTTFMIRNIPNKYTQKMLIDCINTTHANTYDFVYLRIDFKNKCNVGYAFINFIEPKFAVSFIKEKEGRCWKHFNSDKKCSLSYANIQGKDALIKKFKNSTVMSEQRSFRPKLFYSSGPNKGKEQDFPRSGIQFQSNNKSCS